VVSKTYRAYNPTQSFLLPPSPLEWLPEEHLAYFILDVVRELDISPIHAWYEAEERGQPPYHPSMMVGLLLYAYCVGVPSSRKIEAATHQDVAFRVIAGGAHPDHSRISEFRRIHSSSLQDLFVQVLQLCVKAGLVKLGHVAIDGTKMKASASKHKAMSYERMKEKEAALRAKVAELLKAAEDADAEEDARYGKGKRGDELPEELRRAKSRLEVIRKARRELEAEAKEQAEAEKKPEDPPPPGEAELPEHQIPTEKDGKPTPKAQRNFTEPESRIQKAGGDYVQGYNAQAAVDGEAQVIVAEAVTNQPPDAEHLLPMIDQVEANCGQVPEALSADAGYYSQANIQGTLERGCDPHIPPVRSKHRPAPVVIHGPLPKATTFQEEMTRKLATRAGRAIYAKRKIVVEPVFGQIKEVRGFRRFIRRGLEKARAEWSLICTTHNLLKLFRAAAAA
jgi:transposase